MIGIYKITSPTGRIYIGQTIDYSRRINDYSLLKCKNQKRLYNSLIKYSYNSHTFELIEKCEIEFLNSRERYWQEHYNVLSKIGLNCILVNTAEKAKVFSEEIKRKISKKNKGKLISKESREKMSNSRKGKFTGINNPMFGKIHKNESIEKMKIAQSGKNNGMYGKNHSIETKNKLSNYRKILPPNNCRLVLDLQTGIFYESIREVAFAKNLNEYTLRNRLNGLLKNNTNLIKI